jgi:hypothetical protein
MPTQLAQLDWMQMLALAAALGWASGIRLYAVLFFTGMAGVLGWLQLPTGLQLLQNPVVLAASGFMLFVEFFADKIPGLDSLWDAVHTVIRIPAGAALAGAVFGIDDHAAIGLAAAILGGTLAATSHTSKATTRAAINASPEPFSNIAMSLAEDALVAGGLWLAYNYPLVFLACLLLFVLLALWLIRVLWKFVARLVRRLVAIFSGGPDPQQAPAAEPLPAPQPALAATPAPAGQLPPPAAGGPAPPPWSALP